VAKVLIGARSAVEYGNDVQFLVARQWSQDDIAHDGKHDGVYRHSETKRKRRDDRKSGGSAERLGRMAEISQEPGHDRGPPRIAAFLTVLIAAAEFLLRRETGVFLVHSRSDIFLDQHVEMVAHFGVEFGLLRVAFEQAAPKKTK
jgi:hypothetical protein